MKPSASICKGRHGSQAWSHSCHPCFAWLLLAAVSPRASYPLWHILPSLTHPTLSGATADRVMTPQKKRPGPNPQVALVVENLPANAEDVRDAGSIPGSGRFPWRRAWQPTPVFLPGESHGQRSLVGYSPWRCKEWSDLAHGTIPRTCEYVTLHDKIDLS